MKGRNLAFAFSLVVFAAVVGCGGSGSSFTGTTDGGNAGGSGGTGATGGTGSGAPQLYEGFGYAENSDLAMADGGNGFLEPWTGPSPDSGVVGLATVSSGNLTSGDLQVAGNSVIIEGGSFQVMSLRRRPDMTFGTPGTTVWMSFVIDGAAAGNSGGVMLGTLTTDPDAIPKGMLLVGDPTGEDKFGLEHLTSFGQLSGPTSASNVDASGKAVLVVRMTFKNGADTFDLFVNPTPGATPPTAPNATLSFDLGEGPADLQIFAWGKAAGDVSYRLDEIRAGSSFASVLPGS